MSDMMENKLNAEELTEVTGGVGRQEIEVKSITGLPSLSTLIAYSVMIPELPVFPGRLNTPSK